MSIQKKSLPRSNAKATNLKQPAQSWIKLPMLLLIVAIGIVLLATTAMAESPAGATSADTAPAVATLPPHAILLSPISGGSIKNPTGHGGTLKYANEDIVRCTPVADSCNWDLYFDGSDVGLSTVNLEDFEVLGNGNIIFTIDRTSNIPKLGGGTLKVTPRDVIEFVGATGSNTTGAFKLCLPGSSVGLDKSGEDIDALALTGPIADCSQLAGKLVVSIKGSGNVPGAGAIKDEDLIRLDSVAGGSSWSLYLKGSPFKLTSDSEDVAAAWIDPSSADHDVYLTTKGNFSAQSTNSRSGKSTDILGIAPASSNPIASGFLFRYFDAKSNGFTKGIDGLFALPATAALAQQALVTSATDDSVTADNADDAPELSTADLSDSELNAYDYIDVNTTVYLPVIQGR